jgi:hypothetical protein
MTPEQQKELFSCAELLVQKIEADGASPSIVEALIALLTLLAVLCGSPEIYALFARLEAVLNAQPPEMVASRIEAFRKRKGPR